MRCSELFHGKQWVKRRENEPWASAECSGPQHDISKPETTLPDPKSGLGDSNEGPRLVVCGNSERRQTSWFQIFQSFHRAGVHVALRKDKGMSKAVQTNSPTQKNMTCIKKNSTISTYIVPEVTSVITGFAWQRMVYKARMNPGHAAESAQGLV